MRISKSTSLLGIKVTDVLDERNLPLEYNEMLKEIYYC